MTAIAYDNRSPRRHLKAPLAALGIGRHGHGMPHFLFSVNGRTIAYCYIRKNACSAFKQMIIDHSAQRHLYRQDDKPIDFMVRHHEENRLDLLARCDAAVFVYREPTRRVTSLYTNKFIVRSGHGDLFADYRATTGRDPETATFADFVEHYLTGDLLARDPHVWPQHLHLHRIRYTHAIAIGDLHAAMGGVVGAALADRYFARKVNASVGRRADGETDLGDTPAEILRARFLDHGILPDHGQLAAPALAERIAGIYAADVELVGRLTALRDRNRVAA